jgi:hypothetical protein
MPAYNALYYGVAADGSTDDTSAWNTLFASVLTAGGGWIYLPGGRTSRCNSALNPVPFVNTTTSQVPLRVSGAGAMAGTFGFPAVGASILDLRFNGQNATLSVTASGGTYTFNYNGSTSASVNFNAPATGAGSIQTALQGTPSGGSLTVSGAYPTYTITGSSLPLSTNTLSLTGGTATITNNNVAKIDTRGYGLLELDHFTIKSGGSDNFPFLQSTNTALYVHENMFYGNSSNSGTACVQDAIVLGGLVVNASTGAAANSDAIFQGYQTRIERNTFEHIRVGVLGRVACNAVATTANSFGVSCGGDSTHGPFTFGATFLTPNGNTFNNNLIESTHYPFGFVFTNGASNNKASGNQMWDPGTIPITAVSGNGTNITFTAGNTLSAGNLVLLSGLGGNFTSLNGQIVTVIATGLSSSQFEITNSFNPGGTTTGTGYTTIATLSDSSTGTLNRFVNTYTPIPFDFPDTMSYQVITSGTSWTNTGGPNGHYDVCCIGPGGGGGAGGTPSSAITQIGGAGGGQGGYTFANLTLTNQTAYTIAIGAAATATGTTAAGGHAGATGNNGGTTTFNNGAGLIISAINGAPGSGGGASSTTDVAGGQAYTFFNVGVGGTGVSVVGTSCPAGFGGSSFHAITVAQNGGIPIGRGAGGGGCGGQATATLGGSAGAPGAFGSAAGGSSGGSATINGTSASAAAATSFGAGGGGGGAGATASGTGGAGGASGPGAIVIIGPYPT